MSILFTSSLVEEWTSMNKVGNTTPNPIDAIFAMTPNVVTRGEIIGLNQVPAILEGELMMKILPAAARNEPRIVGARL